MSPLPIPLAVVTLACLVVPSLAAAQQPLPTGGAQKVAITSEKPVEYTVAAKTAGVLTVAINGEGDMAFTVTDADGQTLPDGSVDRDLNGNSGLEMASITIPEPGTYRVRVRVQSGSSSSFSIGSSWLSFPALARPNADPDSRPSGAVRLEVGKPHEDAIDPVNGDVWDWFIFEPAEAGTLVIVTRGIGDSADLVLEGYLDGEFGQPVERSDQDLQGSGANESVTLTVTKGQKVHVKVSGTFGRQAAKYRIASSLIP